MIFDVKCSELLPKALRAGAAGDVEDRAFPIEAWMKETNSPLAGEMSGHISSAATGTALTTRSSPRRACSRSPGPPGVARLLADLPETFATLEIRIECGDEISSAWWSAPRPTSPHATR